jgi:peroxiredoxin
VTSRSIRSLLVNAVLFLLVFWAVTTFQSRNMLASDARAAPVLRGPTLAGETYELANAASRPVLVYFFAPWCKICAASADNLVRLRRWNDTTDLEIVAVALDWSDIDDVRDYAERHELNMPVLLGDADIPRRWQVYGFPSYYVLDSEHRVVESDIGYTSQLGLWWRTWIVD